jgi:hypothetical protein
MPLFVFPPRFDVRRMAQVLTLLALLAQKYKY